MHDWALLSILVGGWNKPAMWHEKQELDMADELIHQTASP
jgi:hypothetical protein